MANEAGESVPKEAKDFYDKGVEAIRRSNFAYAVELFSSALAIKQDYSEARYYMWYSLWEQQKNEPDPLKIKFVLRRLSAMPLIAKGSSLQRHGKTWEAIYQYEKAIKADAGNVNVLNAIADCLMTDGQTQNAVRMLEAIPQVDKKDYKTLKKIAQIYRSMENYEKARAFYQAAIRANPNDMDADQGLRDLDAIKTMKGHFEDQA